MTSSRTSHIDLALQLQSSARAHRHRRLLLLSGDADACRRQAVQLLETLACEKSLWIGEQPPFEISVRSNNQALQHLGDEVELLIYDAFCGFNPDAFGALSGTLRGGGLLVLLTPSLEHWPKYADPEYARLVVAGQTASDFGGNFLQRLVDLLQSDPSVARVEGGRIQNRPVQTIAETQTAPEAIEGCLTPDQHRAVTAIEQVLRGHRKRPLVLSSDRGRGKSSALGIAAARLMLETKRRILVTAPRRSAVEALFQQAQRLLPDARIRDGDLHAAGSTLVYTAPDHLLSEPQEADLLLIDEAAAIPATLLQTLLENYPRLVFATTMHGYEGTGRSFTLRFREHLDRITPQWREQRLDTPIRWAENDPLEALVFRLLGLDCEPAADHEMAAAIAATTQLDHPDSRWLLHHESTLRQLFGLLVLAHYRTTPKDLRLLLDAPNLQTLLLRHGENIAGAALVSIEGGFDSQLAQAIWAGERRPRGHLMAQSLGAHVGLPSAPRLKGLRVVRIAIHPAAQRRGLGSQLVSSIREHASRQGCDYLGTSFGVSQDLLRFWLANDLQPVRLGLRPGASSGEHALLMVSPITDQGEQMVAAARDRYALQLPALLGDPLRDLPAAMAASLMLTCNPSHQKELDEETWSDLTGFAYMRRGYETSLPAIERLALRGLGSESLGPEDRALLVMRVIQKQPWTSCARQAGLSGRGETENRLRGIMAALLQRFGNQKQLALLRQLNIKP